MAGGAPRVLAVLGAGPGVVADGAPGLDPLDLALVRGEAVFETVRVYAGRPFRLGAHLERLARSAAAIELELPGGLEALAARAVAAAGGGELVLRLVCTRGREGELTSSAFAIAADPPAELVRQREAGVAVLLLPLAVDPRLRAASPWLLPGAKTTSYAVYMAAQRWAQRHGADDAVFTGLGGELLEAPTANVWWRAGRVLRTPGLDLGILAGVTRAALIGLASALGLEVAEGAFDAAELHAADEAFLSSTVREVMPIVRVDGSQLGDGRPGPAAAALRARLLELAAGA